jgi:3'-5' exoribonuclease
MSSDQLDFEDPGGQRSPRTTTDDRDARSDGAPRSEAQKLEAGHSSRVSAADLRPGMTVDEIYLVTGKEVRTTKSGKPFLKLRVGDRSGAVDCMVWENAERLGARFRSGDLVRLQARASEYAGAVQLEASDLVPAALESVDSRAFLPVTYRDIDELKGFLRFHVESVYDPDFRMLLETFFGDPEFVDRFATAPAAKSFHHAYLGGLLEHTVSVSDLADHVCQQYGRINRDLLITAALLHDVGKVEELTYDRSIDYSDAGRFLGHVILGVNLVTDRAGRLAGFPAEKLQLLLHAIVSHHGELEWGSPKRPKTIEALIIHHLDNLDAKVKGFLEIVEGSRDADWTDLRNLFRRPLHVPRANHQEADFLPPVDADF